MEYRQLGTSAINISRIGLGCMSLDPNDEAGFKKVIDKALSKGINFFDTADIYQKGLNEEVLGKALLGKRIEVIIATKVGNVWRADGSGLDWNASKKHILASVDQTLKRLQTDYIDLYQLHGGTIEDNIDETIEAFEWLKKEGKIRFYGISSIRPNVIREYVSKSGIVSVMMQYSLLDRRPEENILDLLLKNNISVLARGSLAQGLLVGKSPKPYVGHSSEQVKQVVDTVKNVSSSLTLAELSIGYVLKHPAITCAVTGSSRVEQLEETVRASRQPLPNEIYSSLSAHRY